MTPEEFRILLALSEGVVLDPEEAHDALTVLINGGLAMMVGTWPTITDEGRKVLRALEVTP